MGEEDEEKQERGERRRKCRAAAVRNSCIHSRHFTESESLGHCWPSPADVWRSIGPGE